MIKVCQLCKSLRLRTVCWTRNQSYCSVFCGLEFKCIWKLPRLKNMVLHQRSPWGAGAFDHLKWTYGGAFERLFGPGEGNLTNANSKSSNAPGVARGGMLNLQFDRYIMGWVSSWTLSNSYSLKTPPTSSIGDLTLRTRCQSSKMPTAWTYFYIW